MLLALRGGDVRVSNLLPMLGGKHCIFIVATPLRWNCRYGSHAVASGLITLEVLQISKRCASDPAWERNPGVGSAPHARWEAQRCHFCNASAVERPEFRRPVISDVTTLEVLNILNRCVSGPAWG